MRMLQFWSNLVPNHLIAINNMLFRIFYFATNFYQCCCCCFLAILIKLILSNSLGLSICQERHFFAEFMSFIFFFCFAPSTEWYVKMQNYFLVKTVWMYQMSSYFQILFSTFLAFLCLFGENDSLHFTY